MGTDPISSRWKRGLSLIVLAVAAATQALAEEARLLDLGNGRALRYIVLDESSTLSSARPAALRMLKFLAEGRIEEAARLSNAPQRRLKVLSDYAGRVGEDGFKQVYARYFTPGNRVIAEVAIDNHRLLVWNLGEAGGQIAGQYFVEVAGDFVMDDVPSPARANLSRVLQIYRNARPSAQKE
jgi:hypothetical protein